MKNLKIIILGATGAVGSEVVKKLLTFSQLEQLSLLGRRVQEGMPAVVNQHTIDIHDDSSYSNHIDGNNIAICTLGVGEPSAVSRETFIKVDKDAVLAFAKACKKRNITHFLLLASVATDANSRNFYLRVKGELIEALKALEFDSLSIFQPSMIITPTNRYGFSQWLTLKLWPILSIALIGKLSKYKGIKVEQLGTAIAQQSLQDKKGVHFLQWKDFIALNEA